VTPPPAHVLVVGNEKGGSGKTTTAMHVLVALIRMRFKVAVIDLDQRQQSLSRYLEYRREWGAHRAVDLGTPLLMDVPRSERDSRMAAAMEDDQNLTEMVEGLRQKVDFVLIDCPGSDQPMVRTAHALADTVVTPINDSLIDLDLLVVLDQETKAFRRPGIYAQMLIEQTKARIAQRRPRVDWIVMRNRLSNLADGNKRHLADLLGQLAKQMGFRLQNGFGERVIFRQLYTSGLTVLDLRHPAVDQSLTMSHVAARSEVRNLVQSLWLPRIEARLELM